MTLYTKEDAEHALPDHFPLVDTDIEVSVGRNGDDLTLWVNKGGIQILRIRLQDAAKDMEAKTLFNFSPFSPDF